MEYRPQKLCWSHLAQLLTRHPRMTDPALAAAQACQNTQLEKNHLSIAATRNANKPQHVRRQNAWVVIIGSPNAQANTGRAAVRESMGENVNVQVAAVEQ